MPEICRAVPGSQKEIIFVDDSDDDTPSILQRCIRESDCRGADLRRGQLTRRGGLSTAVVRGFQLASGEFICTMDADLQHPTDAVPLMLAAARETSAEVVVGSRYTEGLTLKGFQDPGRFLISAFARQLARIALPPVRATSDPLSGFFLLRRSVVEGVRLEPVGCKILLEVLLRGRWNAVADVPYSFHSRNAGVSKATVNEGLLFLKHLRTLRKACGATKDDAEGAEPDGKPVMFVTSVPGEDFFVAYGEGRSHLPSLYSMDRRNVSATVEHRAHGYPRPPNNG